MDQREDQGRSLFQALHRLLRAAGGIPLGDKGLSRMEFYTLSVLLHQEENRPMRVSGLSEALQSAKPGVSRTLGNLERRGLIRRTADPADRRSTQVALTPEGRQLFRQTAAEVSAYTGRVLERMGREEMDQLLGLLDRLCGIMEEVRQEKEEIIC